MPNLNHTVEIALSKKKIIILFIGSVLFVALGVWFILKPETFNKGPFSGSPLFIMLIGIAAILFFGLCAIFAFKKLFDKKPGLIINENGFLDNSSAIAASFISWADVADIYVREISRQKLIMIALKNPQQYIDTRKGVIAKKGAVMNYKLYGAPVSISSNALNCNFDYLLDALTLQWSASQKIVDTTN